MARSMYWPPRRTSTGGVQLTPKTDGGAESLRQIVRLRVLPSRSSNPWTTDLQVVDPVGGSPELVAEYQGQVIDGLRLLELRQRARLQEIPKMLLNTRTGDAQLRIEWANLERQTAEAETVDVIQ